MSCGGGQLIIENPATKPHYLLYTQVFLKQPDYIDKDRTKRGDIFRKPTAYWFFGLKPKHGFTMQQTPESKIRKITESKSGARAGLCSEDRSMITSDYARNFICDNILGITQSDIEQTLFTDIENN